MNAKMTSHLESRVAATVAGEDLVCGDYVTILTETVDLPSYMWDRCEIPLSAHELVRLKVIPEDAGQPFRVVAVCLPFVYAETPSRRTVTIDTRKIHLVRLDRRCAKVVWKRLRTKRKKRGR